MWLCRQKGRALPDQANNLAKKTAFQLLARTALDGKKESYHVHCSSWMSKIPSPTHGLPSSINCCHELISTSLYIIVTGHYIEVPPTRSLSIKLKRGLLGKVFLLQLKMRNIHWTDSVREASFNLNERWKYVGKYLFPPTLICLMLWCYLTFTFSTESCCHACWIIAWVEQMYGVNSP